MFINQLMLFIIIIFFTFCFNHLFGMRWKEKTDETGHCNVHFGQSSKVKRTKLDKNEVILFLFSKVIQIIHFLNFFDENVNLFKAKKNQLMRLMIVIEMTNNLFLFLLTLFCWLCCLIFISFLLIVFKSCGKIKSIVFI